MTDSKRSKILPKIVAGVFFTASFLYLATVNRFLMAYQEQIQLFRFDRNYFAGFLKTPGGFADYLGAFFTQFFLNPIAGTFIVTLLGTGIFALARIVFKAYRIRGLVWSIIPALFLFALQSDYMFNLGYSIGLVLVISFFVIYISLRNEKFRYAFGIIGWTVLYIATGGVSFVAALLILLHESLFSEKSNKKLFAMIAFVVVVVLFPLLCRQTIYYIPFREIWINPALLEFRDITKYTLALLIIYFPISLILIRFVPAHKKLWLQANWEWKTITAGTIFILLLSLGFKTWVYDPRIRLFLEIDHNVQQDKWDKVLELSSHSPVTNHLILYYTNLALYKTGHLEDRMFYYPQIGVPGLWLSREGDELSLFLGGELFYELGNINEATRWAFDAMVANGQSPPRLLKQLILTALINGDYGVAEKYLNILDESLYYRDWAKHYKNYLSNPDLLLNDPEIAAKRHLMIHDDFVSRTNDSDIGLKLLLENHPDNRMAFEYYMTSLLLAKNLNEFVANIERIKEFGYKEIPLHFEEALLIYMGYTKKNAVPQGYGIRRTTVQRFQNYAKAYASKPGDPRTAAESLSGSFGNTYWFYLHFINNRTSSNESKHLFN